MFILGIGKQKPSLSLHPGPLSLAATNVTSLSSVLGSHY